MVQISGSYMSGVRLEDAHDIWGGWEQTNRRQKRLLRNAKGEAKLDDLWGEAWSRRRDDLKDARAQLWSSCCSGELELVGWRLPVSRSSKLDPIKKLKNAVPDFDLNTVHANGKLYASVCVNGNVPPWCPWDLIGDLVDAAADDESFGAFQYLSPDYRAVMFQGEVFVLGEKQADVIYQLYLAYLDGKPWLYAKHILPEGTQHYSHLFKGRSRRLIRVVDRGQLSLPLRQITESSQLADGSLPLYPIDHGIPLRCGMGT